MPSDTQAGSQESEDSTSPLKDLDSKESGHVIGTQTPIESIISDSNQKKEPILQVTLGESIQKTYPTTISFVLDFLAHPSRWRGRGKDFKIYEERYSSRFPELRRLKDLRCFSLKTSQDSSLTMEVKPSIPSLIPWKKWGIGLNGKYLTANISVFPKLGKECLLLDILEKEISPQYFLSQKAVTGLMRALKRPHKPTLLLPWIQELEVKLIEAPMSLTDTMPTLEKEKQ